MVYIYAYAANQFARKMMHWSTMALYIALYDESHVPELETRTTITNTVGWMLNIPIVNPRVKDSGWCYAEPVHFNQIVLPRACPHAIIFDGNPPVPPVLYVTFPIIPASTTPRNFSLLMGVNAPGWFRL